LFEAVTLRLTQSQQVAGENDGDAPARSESPTGVTAAS
jgi:hypothetical protein